MIEVADVFRRFAADYLSAHGASMLPSHRRAIEDILNCRTAALGGQVWRCVQCDTEMFSYHSCRNRSCPKCHTAQTQEWLERRRAEMLPVPYFHITITVPEELREVLRANQRDGYGVLMRASAAAIIELARDRRYVGGTVGVLAVLHTWTQQLNLHPHVHCLVSGGGISEEGPELIPPSEWLPMIWGGEEPEFQTDDEMRTVLGTIMGRYNEIVACLDTDPDDFDPVFLKGPEGEVIASDWAGGFIDAVALRPMAWKLLMEHDCAGILMAPLFLLNGDMEIDDAADENELMAEASDMIPTCIAGIHAFWQNYRESPSGRSRSRSGGGSRRLH